MCMIAGVATKDYGLLATDSASYDMATEKTGFEQRKLFVTSNGKYLATFIGTPLYLANLDHSRFAMHLDSLSLYLTEYLRGMKPKVEEAIKSEIAVEGDREPNVCLFVLGMHRKIPTIAQFNIFHNFEAKYTWTKEEPKFATIHYGGDSTGKNQIFKDASAYMEKRAKRYETLTPGLAGEVLTRGIYKKADLEEKIGEKRKYAGGVVNVAGMGSDGIFALSGLEVAKV